MFYKIFIPCSLTISFVPIYITYTLLKNLRKRKSLSKPVYKKDFKLIFTTFNHRDCKQHIYKQIACSKTCSYTYLLTIVQFIETAKHSVNMCMCLLTCTQIQDALIQAYDRGVQVRFITDIEMAGTTASRISILQDAKIPVKVQTTANTILHHKFCLADEKYPEEKLFFGTLNLTCQGLTSNWDLICFTTNSNIIHRFSEEFEYLWSNFRYF